MNRYEKMDNIGRERFINDFNYVIKAVRPTEVRCPHDLDITGITGQVSAIEVKLCGKQKMIEDFTGNTIINQSKLNHFKKLLSDEHDKIALFARYFTDGMILFDLSYRINNNTPDLEIRHINVGTNTVYDNNNITTNVAIAVLIYNKNIDKIYRYGCGGKLKLIK